MPHLDAIEGERDGVREPLLESRREVCRVAPRRQRDDLDREPLLGSGAVEVEDATFTEPGMVGLWTKADSVTALLFAFGQMT